MSFKFTLVCDTLPWVGYNVLEAPEEVLRAAKEAGYDGVDLPGDPTRMNGGEWKQRVADFGLDVPEVLAAWGYYHAGEERNLASSKPEVRRQALQYAKDTVDLAADIGARYIELCAAQPAVPELPFPREPIGILREIFRESIREVCKHAKDRGISIVLEPLNCYEGIPGVLTTVYEALNYIEELGLDNLGVQPDVFHNEHRRGIHPRRTPRRGPAHSAHSSERDQSLPAWNGTCRLQGDFPDPERNRVRRLPRNLLAADHAGDSPKRARQRLWRLRTRTQ